MAACRRKCCADHCNVASAPVARARPLATDGAMPLLRNRNEDRKMARQTTTEADVITRDLYPTRSRAGDAAPFVRRDPVDRKSTRLNSSHVSISYAVFCLKK